MTIDKEPCEHPNKSRIITSVKKDSGGVDLKGQNFLICLLCGNLTRLNRAPISTNDEGADQPRFTPSYEPEEAVDGKLRKFTIN